MKTQAVRTLVLVALLASISGAQSWTELLEKGIYTQDTLGDVEAAIRIYQQIIGAAPLVSEVHLHAQRRLQAAEAQRREVAAHALLGTFDGRTYRHMRTGMTFNVPEGWTVHPTSPSSDHGEMVTMSAVNPAANVNVWMIKEKNGLDSIDNKLDASPADKVQNRHALGYEGYRLRQDSVHRVYIGGHQAIVAIADYTDVSSRRAMAEYLTWIYTLSTHTFFFAFVAADDLELLRPQFDSMVYSAIIP